MHASVYVVVDWMVVVFILEVSLSLPPATIGYFSLWLDFFFYVGERNSIMTSSVVFALCYYVFSL